MKNSPPAQILTWKKHDTLREPIESMRKKGGILMNMKKAFALLLALCLLLTAVPALAAPTRDAQAMEVTVDEKVTALTSLIVNAAILQGVPLNPATAPVLPPLVKDELPSDLLVSCALAWGIKAGLLPYNAEIGDQDTIALTAEQAEELYRQIFTNSAYAFPTVAGDALEAYKDEHKNCTWYAGDTLNVALVPLCNYGVYIYSATFDGTDAVIRCDVFTAKETEVQLSADEIPEDALVWECNAVVSLRSAPDAPFGYTVNGVSVSPFYQAGDLSQWTLFENEDMEYSVNLPAILGVSDDTAAYRVWQSADGQVSLTISVVEQKTALEEAEANYKKTYPDARIIKEQEFDRFSVVQEGSFTMVTTSEEAERLYMISFTFPAEYQAEYEFYAEIIRNSLSVWGLSNG